MKSSNCETVEGVKLILKGTKLEQYTQSFFDSAQKTGISSYFLASKAMVESAGGESALASGVNVNGITVYNLHGIGANTGSALSAGSQFAYSQTKYGAPWDSPEDAIYGAALFFESNYGSKRQDTLFTIRYNIHSFNSNASGNKFTHEYSANIGMAYVEAHHFSSALQDNPDAPLVFKIPVYKDWR